MIKFNRRCLLKSALGAAVSTFTTRRLLAGLRPKMPMLELKTIFSTPIKIESIELLQVGKTYYVRTISSDGAAGVTSANDRLLNTLTLFRNLIIPYFKGKDARDLETLVDGVYTYDSYYKYAGMPFWNAVGHIEISLFDMMGRISGQPAGLLLGKKIRSEIPVYISRSSRETSPEEEIEQVEESLAKTGTKAVKLKIGGRMFNNAHFTKRTNQMIQLARKRLGDNITIYVDSNGSYDADEAIEVGRMLQKYDVGFFEEPCGWQEYEQTKRVTDTLDMTVAGGEQDTSLAQFDWMIRHHVVDLVQPDLYYNGGFIRCLRVARMAEKAGMKITPHSPKSGADAAAMLHFASIVPNLGPHQEYRASQDVKNGLVKVPTGPGLGIQIEPKSISDAERIISA